MCIGCDVYLCKERITCSDLFFFFFFFFFFPKYKAKMVSKFYLYKNRYLTWTTQISGRNEFAANICKINVYLFLTEIFTKLRFETGLKLLNTKWGLEINISRRHVHLEYLCLTFEVPPFFFLFFYMQNLIGLVGSVCQWSGRPGFNPRSHHTKDFKNGTWYLLINTQQYKVHIKGKVEQCRERSSALP